MFIIESTNYYWWANLHTKTAPTTTTYISESYNENLHLGH